MFKRLLTALISLALILFSNVVIAQEKREGGNAIDKLNTRILELQQQIIEIQKKHDDEIAALKKQIDELAAAAGRQKKEEEIAALRQAAKAEVTETIATKDTPEEVVFESGSLGLQALNP
jgi:predicted PurR-regulated permease PerM